MKDYFISYNTNDEMWAEWVSWQIEESRRSTIMQRWDFTVGSNFVIEMQKAIEYAQRIILILSEDFLRSKFTSSEWAAFFSKDPNGSKRLIVPIRVKPCNPTGLLSQIVYLDLVDKNETQCKALLKELLNTERSKPQVEPVFPSKGHIYSLLSENYPTLEKPRGNRKNAPKRLAKEIQKAFKERDYEPFHIRERRYGRAFLVESLKYLLNHHFKHPEIFGELSILVIDVDGMSGINRAHGVNVGDNVIRNIVSICCEEPSRLISGRMGDDTIFCILSNVPEQKATKISESLVIKIASHKWDSLSDGLFVTCSIGFAEFSDIERADDAILRAVQSLQGARRKGGNRAETLPLQREHTNFKKIYKQEMQEEFEIEKRNGWLHIIS